MITQRMELAARKGILVVALLLSTTQSARHQRISPATDLISH
jgi:hypothetical protein